MATKASDTIIKAVAAITVAGALVSQAGPSDVKICDVTSKTCQTVTAQDYALLKADIADRVKQKSPLSFDEYYLYLAMVNRELKLGKSVGKLQASDDITTKLTNLLYE